MQKPVEPKRILCLHDLSGVGRCSLSVILPVLAVLGHQPVALPTVLLSTHTGGLGAPAVLPAQAQGLAALEHYRALGLSFDCIYTGYLGGEGAFALAETAFSLWPDAFKVVDPVLGDSGRPYSGVTPAMIGHMQKLAARADLILPNLTETGLLLGCEVPALPGGAEAEAFCAGLSALAPQAVVTGILLGDSVACVGAGREHFVLKKLHLARSYPGTGDLYGALLVGALLRGNALSAAADAAAEFVADAIRNTSPDADPRFGVWFEPLLGRLAPQERF